MALQALVTGATGFIGSHLALRLKKEGWKIRLLVRNPKALEASLQDADIIVGALSDSQALAQAVQGVDVIFHCAANVHTWDRYDAYYTTNVEGTRNLVEAIAGHNPKLSRFVHISTVDVYGFPVTPCNEDSPISVSDFGYGDTKCLGEIMVREFFSARDIAYTVIRPANVIGPRSQFIERIGKELRSGLMLKVDGGRCNAGLLYIDNLLDYLLWAAQAEQAANECYNVRDSYDVSWAEFVSYFRKAIGGRGLVLNLPFAVADYIARGMEAVYSVLVPAHEPLLHRLIVRIFGRTCGHNADKIRGSSGFNSKVSFEEAMQISINWFKSQK